MGKLVCTNPNETRDQEFVQYAKDKDGKIDYNQEIGKVTFSIGSLSVRVADRINKLSSEGRFLEASELAVKHSIRDHKGDLELDGKPLEFSTQKDEWTGKKVVSDWLLEVYLATGFLALVGSAVLKDMAKKMTRSDLTSIKNKANEPEKELDQEKNVEPSPTS